jgi:tRNA dimethylallyltransferase
MGPTALGKTAVAVEVALALGGDIVTADSMQVYSGLPIVTNQPTTGELRRVPHHLVGYVDPHEEYSAAAYAAAAHATIDQLHAAAVPVVLEGGSGLYVRAALGGLRFGAPPSPQLRADLERRLEDEGVAALYEDLERRDPQAAARSDAANPRRVLRALETVLDQTAGPASPGGEHDRLWLPGTRYPYILFALDEERDVLRRRVDQRVPAMISAGALEEVAALLAAGTPSRTVAQAIGVRELSDHLAGRSSLDEAVATMQSRTWRFVRRQLTWMRKLPDAVTIRVSGRPPAAVAEEIAGTLRSLS